MADILRKLTTEEHRREFRRRVIGDFVKYYNRLTDEEAFAVQKIVIDAKNRFSNQGKQDEEDECDKIHGDA